MAVAYLHGCADLDAQRVVMEAWALAHEIRIIAWCADERTDGDASIEARPELARALMLLREQDAGVLVVSQRDEDVIIAAMIERLAADAGAVILSLADDSRGRAADPNLELFRRMIDAFADYERAMTAMRTRRALAAKRTRGEALGGMPPWGFRLSDDKRSWVPDEGEQRMLALVRELHQRGHGARQIARTLEAAGFRTRNGRRIQHSSVVKMIQNMAREGAAAA